MQFFIAGVKEYDQTIQGVHDRNILKETQVRIRIVPFKVTFPINTTVFTNEYQYGRCRFEYHILQHSVFALQ